jgi:hypothetical protein
MRVALGSIPTTRPGNSRDAVAGRITVLPVIRYLGIGVRWISSNLMTDGYEANVIRTQFAHIVPNNN